MGSAAITTVVKMMETLPENAQNLVVEHMREYIATMQDEDVWDTAFQKTQSQLAAARAPPSSKSLPGKPSRWTITGCEIGHAAFVLGSASDVGSRRARACLQSLSAVGG